MSTQETPALARLFAIPTPRTKLAMAEEAGREAEVERQVRPATYTALTTNVYQPGESGGHLVMLRVVCPYCGHSHIHPGGTTTRPMRGIRQARCIGSSTLGLHYELTGGEE